MKPKQVQYEVSHGNDLPSPSGAHKHPFFTVRDAGHNPQDFSDSFGHLQLLNRLPPFAFLMRMPE